MGYPVLADEPQAVGGVESLHEHNGAPHPVHAHAEHQRGRVIKGGGRQIDAGVVHAVVGHAQGGLNRRVGWVADAGLGGRLADAFGPASGATRVHHLPALALVGDRRGGQIGGCSGHRLEPVWGVGASGEAHRHPGQVQLGQHRSGSTRRHHRGGTAVVEHRLDLASGEVVVDRRVDQTRQLGGPEHRHRLRGGLRHDGQMVPGIEAPSPKQSGPTGWPLRPAPGR